MSVRQDEESIRRCIANLCSHLDTDLVNALLDDEQLLENFHGDRGSLLCPIVKAFRQLHAQLKEELICASSGGSEAVPLHLLSILEKQHKNKRHPINDVQSEEEQKFVKKGHSAELPDSSCREGPSESDHVKSIEMGNNLNETKKSGKHLTEQVDTKRRNVLEFQFIDAFSISPVGNERGADFVDRSVQVETDLVLPASLHANLKADTANFGGEINEKYEKIEKEDENLVESVSAASIYNARESSFSTTMTPMNSTNSTEKSVGEVDRRKLVQLLATRSDIKVHSVDTAGAIITSASKRASDKCRRNSTTQFTQKRGERRCFESSPNSSAADNNGGSTSSSHSPAAVVGQLVAPSATKGRHYSQAEDELVEVLSANVLINNGLRRSLAAREVSFHSSFDTTKLLNALREEGRGKEKEAQSNGGGHGQGNESGANEGEEEEEQSTLNQVTPIPTTLELSSSSA